MDESQDFIHLPSLLKCLLECSEKACKIAQVCRSDKSLFELLIQEKKDGEKNMRFLHDFKTLADVLIQETVKWEVKRKFPSLHARVYGEESNHFENAFGESVDIWISESAKETEDLLFKVLDGREDAAKVLAECVYHEHQVNLESPVMNADASLPSTNLGIWIDPIDSTGEYVRSTDETATSEFLVSHGLKCVCALIGAYNTVTGLPVIGVVNQPFFLWDSSKNQWQNKYYWGLYYGSTVLSSVVPQTPPQEKKVIVVSSSEDKILIDILKAKYCVCEAAGAGYKSLVVACGYADLYMLSHPATYYWDTCAPHGILLSLGGGIADFRKAVSIKKCRPEDLLGLQLKYTSGKNADNEPSCLNSGGIVAYRNPECLIELLNYLDNSHVL